MNLGKFLLITNVMGSFLGMYETSANLMSESERSIKEERELKNLCLVCVCVFLVFVTQLLTRDRLSTLTSRIVVGKKIVSTRYITQLPIRDRLSTLTSYSIQDREYILTEGG